MFLPARTPYDRQVVAEHVSAYLRASGQVQVLVDERRWMVQFVRAALPVCCCRCDATVDVAWLSPAEGQWVYCARCALASGPTPFTAFRQPRRHAG